MTFPRFLTLLALLLLFPVPAQAAGDSGWLYRGSDIPRDPAWTFGTLPNGLRYAVRRNALPAGQVSIRLRMDAGAFDEEAGQLGWAHFIEHMVFRGTAGLGDGEARETWQKLGASFGSDTNATTEPTQTVYQLDLPHADRATLDTSLKLLAEMADSARFDPAIVETERQVVLSERRRRSELATRLGEVTRPLFYAGLRYRQLDVGGTEQTLAAASAPALRAFYERWYRPERATLILVGDADPAMLEALVAARFGGWKGEGPAPGPRDDGRPDEVAESTAILTYPGAPERATVQWIRPFRAGLDTKAREQEELGRALAERIVNRRLEAKARGEASFLSAAIGSENATRLADYTQLVVVPKEGRWKEALAEAFGIVKGVLAVPPSEAEIAREIANWRTSALAAVQGEPTRRSPQLAQRLVSAVDDGEVVSTAAVTLALIEEFAPHYTPASVQAAAKALFSGSPPRMVLLSPKQAEGAAAALAAAEAAPAAGRNDDRQVTMADLPPLGAPGREVSRQRVDDMDVTIVRFANGSSLIFKKTPFEQGSIGVGLRFGSGAAGLASDSRPLTWLAPLIVPSGIGTLDQEALERLLTGRRASLSFGVDEDAYAMRGATSGKELEDQLRLLAAKLAAPRWDAQLFERFRASGLSAYELSFASASARTGREFPAFVRGGDGRWAPVDKAMLEGAKPADFERFFTPLLATGPVEVVVVGDVDLEDAIEAVRNTVAALPRRPEATVAAAGLGMHPPAPSPKPVTFTHSGDPSQAQALIGWTTFGGKSGIRERRALSLAANMLQVRLYERLRDVQGRTYSPGASVSSSETFPGWGIFYASAEVRPEDAPGFLALAREIVADLAAKPAAADEWARTINPVLSGLERRLQTNGYWMNALEDWSRKPELIEQTRSLVYDYRSITPEEVRSAVAKYVTDQGDWSMLVLPARIGASVH
jgi:zinc protease